MVAKRVTRRRGLAVTGAFATSAAFLAACGGDGGGESTPEPPKGSGALSPIVDETKSVKRGGIFPAIQITPQPSIDPHLVGGAVAFTWHAYSQLFRPKEGYMEPASGEFEGELAESWELSPDKTQITVKLKQGVKFAPKPPVNARDLDASDIIFSWNRFKSISPRAGELSNERSPNAPVLSLTQIDNRTISIKTKEPLATILGGFAGSLPGNFWIVPREAEDTSKLDLKGNSAGTGAVLPRRILTLGWLEVSP
jgi:peptide/nickel transport system substrate-binding protein